MTSYTFITPNILHVKGDSCYAVASLFVRIQEYYESGSELFRGSYFTLDEFMDWYARQNGGKFTYFEDWAGFNIPGDVMLEFWEKFQSNGHQLRDKEERLFSEVQDFIDENNGDFYVIGTYGDNDKTLQHELLHAKFYLDSEYRRKCNEIVMDMPKYITDAAKVKLTEMGYSTNVHIDEIQAYFGTDSLVELSERFGISLKDATLWSQKFKNVKT